MISNKVQMPNDVKITGCKLEKDYTVTTFYHSDTFDFTGTEEDFINMGYAYEFKQVCNFKRVVV